MARNSDDTFFEKLQRVLHDGADYFKSQMELLQARAAEFALSSVVFILLLLAAALLGIAGFVFLNIAIGFWLNQWLNNGALTVTLLGAFYFILAAISASIALRWLNQLKS